MNIFTKIIEMLFFAEQSPEAMRRWRLMVSMILLMFMICGFWAIGGLARFGLPGFLVAPIIDNRISQAIAPLHEEQVRQGSLLSFLSDQVRDSLAEGKAAEIRAVSIKRCKSHDEPERDNFTREIDRKQAEYFKLNSRYYSTPTCDQL